MKKIAILLLIVFIGIFAAACAFDHVYYCPYCSYGNVDKIEDGKYKCTRDACGKTFGAKEIK